jgi:uncharacterized protein Usg
MPSAQYSPAYPEALAIKPTQPQSPRRSHTTQEPTSQKDDAMSLQAQLDGYRLTTAQILYHLPDHPSLLQTYVWQEYDVAPRFPRLEKFLDFWHRTLDGKLHSVQVVSAKLISPAEWRHTRHLKHLH